ncbi:hypothetical protein DFR67_10124 [Williamsia limnetica]|jgi:hypothetical protein|uniref:Uncharacterized protein n=1 Tax=Williamsia limnetica TaxID=882452 RepID=A0A318RTK5_WILLI|nr:hypothetical protein [Williamsia limnetica]PYE20635.1 hypothetical protein DFR67_10124 [Williamsia limnetica]
MQEEQVTIVQLTRSGAHDQWFGQIWDAVESTPAGSHLHVVFPPEHDVWEFVIANLGGCSGITMTSVPKIHDSVSVFDAVAHALAASGRPWTWSKHRSGRRKPALALRERLRRLQPN